PDYGHSPFEEQDPDWEEAMSMYRDAATAGRQMFDCGYIYSGCPQGQGILDIITALRDE
ncbi:jg25467, partial [Pararge aegeria aegeria]